MLCPNCKTNKNYVTVVKYLASSNSINRIRECPRCKHKFSTTETVDNKKVVGT